MFAKLAVIAVTAFSASVLADQPASQPDTRSAARPVRTEGMWPTPKLMDSLLRRWAQIISDRHDLNDEQTAKVEDVVVKRWGKFLTDNRSRIQPLLNEFAEMQMDMKPPEKERVRAWAKQAAPVFEQFRSQVKGGNAEVRKLLDPAQGAKFDVEAMAFEGMMTAAELKLKQWENGEVGEFDFWMPTPKERRKQREQLRMQKAKGEVKPADVTLGKVEEDQIARELDAWDTYVAEFIRLYELDEAQRASALSCLNELKQRATAHRDTRREDIARLEARIKDHTGSVEDLAGIKTQLSELYGPVDDMFKQLKERLNLIPTAQQRAKVAAEMKKGD